jgi:hypothetical protein
MASKEAKLQSECVKWYRNEWYKNPKSLWATFNEGQNVSGKISIGLQGGVSDLLLYERNGRGLIGIEMKYPGESHNVLHVIRQAQWILDVCDCGGLVDNLFQFQRIIQGESAWYDPERVLAYLDTIKTKSFVWDGSKFL